MYEKPTLFELGDASELTLGRMFGDWDDGTDSYVWRRVF